jgi:hypothetical protein
MVMPTTIIITKTFQFRSAAQLPETRQWDKSLDQIWSTYISIHMLWLGTSYELNSYSSYELLSVWNAGIFTESYKSWTFFSAEILLKVALNFLRYSQTMPWTSVAHWHATTTILGKLSGHRHCERIRHTAPCHCPCGPDKGVHECNECDNMKDKRGITREQNGNDTVVSATLRCCS